MNSEVNGELVSANTTLHLGDILGYIRDHWVLCSSIALLSLAAGTVFLVITDPVYRSEAIILPITEQESGGQLARLGGSIGGLASLAGISVPGAAMTSAGLATLRSKDLAARLIDQAALMPVLFEADWDAQTGGWLDDPPTVEEAVNRFDKRVRTVLEDKDTGLVTVRVEWQDPGLAAAWAARIVRMADDDLRQRAVAEAQASMLFLEKELRSTSSVELQAAIYSLMESEMKKTMLAKVRPEYAFRMIDPPRTSDSDDPVWPNPILVLGASLLMGVGLIFLIAVTRTPYSRSPASA